MQKLNELFNYKMVLIGILSSVMGGCNDRQANTYEAEADQFLQNMPTGLQDRQCAAILQALDGDNTALVSVRNGRNASSQLNEKVKYEEVTENLRLYTPVVKQSAPLPLLVYLHGGGWTFGSINSCARYCAELTATGSVKVLAVNYRLAPEYPYPCGLNDCVEAFHYARAHAEEWGSAPDLVSVGGDSSGGNLALAVTLRLLQQHQPLPHSLVLYYPVVAAWNDNSSSWQKYATGKALDGSIMEAFNRAYCEGVHQSIKDEARTNALISPSVATDEALARLPKILFTAAERDILYDQGKEFADRLQKLGVEVTHQTLKGSVHLFITVEGQEKAFRKAVCMAEDFLKSERKPLH